MAVLWIGNLLPRIRSLYRAEAIDRTTVRHLTLASKSQQKAWLALFDDPDTYAPTGHQLKAWLFGGQSIPVRFALFDLDRFDGAIVADLFGEDRYFADADAFWTAQNAAIEARRATYLEQGWSDVVIMAAAVADYRPADVSESKIKKDASDSGLTLELVRNPDILAGLGHAPHDGTLLVGIDYQLLRDGSEQQASIRLPGGGP